MRKGIWLVTGLMIVIIIAVFIAGLVFSSFLPKIARNRIVAEISRATGLDLSMVIRKIDLFGMDAADVLIKGENRSGIRIDAIRIDYSPGSLFQKKITGLSINGVDLYAEYRDGRFRIPGLVPYPEKRRPEPTPGGSRDAVHDIIDGARRYGIETLKVENATLYFCYGGREFRIPMEAELHLAGKNSGSLTGDLLVNPFGQKIHLSMQTGMDRENLAFQVKALNLSLDAFHGVYAAVPGMMISGAADLSGAGDLGLASMELGETVFNAKLYDFFLQYHTVRGTLPEGEKKNTPVSLQLRNRPDGSWTFSIPGLMVETTAQIPVRLSLKDFSAIFDPASDRITAEGDLEPVSTDTADLKIEKQGETSFRMTAALDLAAEADARWELQVRNPDDPAKPENRWNVLSSGVQYGFAEPNIEIKAAGTGAVGTMSGSFSFARCRVEIEDLKLNFPSLNLKGTGKIDFSGASGLVSGEIQAVALTSRITMPGLTMALPRFFISAGTENMLADKFELKGNIVITGASAILGESGIAASGIHFSLPLVWPMTHVGKFGELNVTSIKWDKKEIGGITTRVRQKGMGLDFNGKHRSRLIPGGILSISGESGFQDSEWVSRIRYNSDFSGVAGPIDLGLIFHAAAGWSLEGQLSLTGDLFQGADLPGHQMKAALKNGVLRKADQNLLVEGIHTEIVFPDIFQLKSAPQQPFSFTSARLGGIEVQNGMMAFQVESAESFFIEKSRFGWVNGQVETQALRITPASRTYEVVLHCDRLNLAAILNQFGAADAEGKGTVNGRIPLKYADGKWLFNDGFLYSSPGEGGRIKIQETEKWAAAVPPGTPQYTQIQLAQEALKDYEYNWAKVGFQTVGDDLLMKLNFNGQPTESIPFTYNRELGGFVKLEAEGAEGIRPEVFLELNFKLPLQEVLKYREFLDMIQ